MKKVKFIYNPYSGDKSIVKKIDTILEIYQDNNYSVIPFRINRNVFWHRAIIKKDNKLNT